MPLTPLERIAHENTCPEAPQCGPPGEAEAGPGCLCLPSCPSGLGFFPCIWAFAPHSGDPRPQPSAWLVAGATMGFVTETQSPGHGGPGATSFACLCLSLVSAAASLTRLCFSVSLFLFFSVVPELSLPQPHPSCCNPENATVGRPGQSLLWYIPRHTLALTGDGCGAMWSHLRALSVSSSLCVSTCVFLCLSHPMGTQSKDLPLCVCVNQGRLPGGGRAGVLQRPGESLSHRGSRYLGGNESTQWSTTPNPLLLSPRG